uniref:Uncharacterized protein n=1 Tax=Guillardia theta TaxID=55529 RepID=A0A7S4PEW6_GUITH|mmetsp:Transcript_49547/g.155227  ORF Transcript_49547/g.155227 Transcript_49547/m.155227 type:complete len:111 (+) Transcript_49547:304-636(+)
MDALLLDFVNLESHSAELGRHRRTHSEDQLGVYVLFLFEAQLKSLVPSDHLHVSSTTRLACLRYPSHSSRVFSLIPVGLDLWVHHEGYGRGGARTRSISSMLLPSGPCTR